MYNTEQNQRRRQRRRDEKKAKAVLTKEGRWAHRAPILRRKLNRLRRETRDLVINARPTNPEKQNDEGQSGVTHYWKSELRRKKWKRG